MRKGNILFFVGLFTYLSGIYLSTLWVILGVAIGVLGGLIMGASTYFIAMKR